MLDPQFAATAEVSGSITIDGNESTISGSAEFDASDSFQELTIDLPTGEVTQGTLSVDDEAFTRIGTGPWVRQATGGSSASLTEQFADVLAELEDEGIEEVDGESLHHLAPSGEAELDAAAFGITDPAIEDFSAVVDFYATPAGAPAIMRFTLSWTQNGQEAGMVLEYALNPDANPTIETPEEAWLPFASSRFAYGIAYPEDWELIEAEATADTRAYDAFYSLQGSQGRTGEVDVYAYPAEEVAPYTASEWFTDAGLILAEDFGVEVEFTEQITVAGSPSRYYSLHYLPEGGSETFFQEAVIYTGTAAWDVDWFSDSGNENVDRETFDLFLATFTPGAPSVPTGDESLGNVWELSAGECFNSNPPLMGVPGVEATQLGGVEGYEPADCATPHAAEVIAVLDEGATATCADAFADYVGVAPSESSLGLWTFIPVDANYERIPGPSLCIVAHPSGSLTGSIEGTAQ